MRLQCQEMKVLSSAQQGHAVALQERAACSPEHAWMTGMTACMSQHSSCPCLTLAREANLCAAAAACRHVHAMQQCRKSLALAGYSMIGTWHQTMMGIALSSPLHVCSAVMHETALRLKACRWQALSSIIADSGICVVSITDLHALMLSRSAVWAC